MQRGFCSTRQQAPIISFHVLLLTFLSLAKVESAEGGFFESQQPAAQERVLHASPSGVPPASEAIKTSSVRVAAQVPDFRLYPAVFVCALCANPNPTPNPIDFIRR